jgi:NAD(P)H-flavin reductase
MDEEVDITLEVVADPETGATGEVHIVGPPELVQQVVDACMSEDTEVDAELLDEGTEDAGEGVDDE